MGIKGKETIIIERKSWGIEDQYGNPTFETIQINVPNCLVAWGNSSESGDIFGLTVDTTATLQLPKGTVIANNDIFILPNSKRYIQTGGPIQWVGQTGNPIKQKVLVNVTLKESGNDA